MTTCLNVLYNSIIWLDESIFISQFGVRAGRSDSPLYKVNIFIHVWNNSLISSLLHYQMTSKILGKISKIEFLKYNHSPFTYSCSDDVLLKEYCLLISIFFILTSKHTCRVISFGLESIMQLKLK